MSESTEARPFELPTPGGARLSGETAGEGRPVVLLHGLSATRWYVVLGSRHLARSGHRVIAYDARGHGLSSPPDEPRAYAYSDLASDLEAVFDGQEFERAVLVGNSMGAHTALAFTLAHPERVEALVLVTPAYEGSPGEDPDDLAGWDRLAAGLREGGVEGFLDAYDPSVAPSFRDTVMRFTRQRLERHRHPEAVADALEVVPRSAPFDGLEPLAELDVPALVVGSRDEADPGHPLRVARTYAERLPDAELVVEDEDKSPLAWQGAQLSREISAFLGRRLA